MLQERSLYQRHSEEMKRRLANFNYQADGLFAFSKNDIRIYELNTSPKFLRELLRSRNADRIDPFYRFSLAQQAEDRELIDKCFDMAVRTMRVDCPEFLAEWIKRNTPGHRHPSDFSYLWSSSIQESALKKLLHQTYGFKHNKHRKGLTSWDWIENNEIIVPALVSWQNEAFDIAKIAFQLGLEPTELAKAANGEYSESVLLLILLISQVHRFLFILNSRVRARLILRAEGILRSILKAPLTEEELKLLSTKGEMIKDITNFPETSEIGHGLLSLIRWGSL